MYEIVYSSRNMQADERAMSNARVILLKAFIKVPGTGDPASW